MKEKMCSAIKFLDKRDSQYRKWYRLFKQCGIRTDVDSKGWTRINERDIVLLVRELAVSGNCNDRKDALWLCWIGGIQDFYAAIMHSIGRPMVSGNAINQLVAERG